MSRATATCLVPVLAAAVLLTPRPAGAGPAVLDAGLHHLRAGAAREWADFPAEAEGPSLTVTFRAAKNAAERALRLRQQDVKQSWAVLLNGKELGRLAADENDTVVYLPVPPGRLADGENTLVIRAAGRNLDDIRVGEIALADRPVAEVLSEAAVEVTVLEDQQAGGRGPVPCRVTVTDGRGALVTTGAASTDRLAVRPGVIYTADGTARFGLPAGEYTITAGRGFEYGVDSVRVSLRPGNAVRKTLVIRREVPTPGFVGCDPHVHTLTHSGHGDATDVERAVTIAGEGLELPVATEHNKQVYYHAAAVRAGVRSYFTPVVGNEVTTAVGHVNVFPVPAGGPVPDFKVKDWKALAAALQGPPRVAVLNHPRDLHAGFRPFGPDRHLAPTGERIDGWELPANAVEVVNSGAQQTDVMRPVRDWFGLLNRGVVLTPVGSSDSHDVSRYIVGQGRTYVRCRDDRPGEIDPDEAVTSFTAGRVLVSCGLLAEITVDGKHGPGDVVPTKGDVRVSVRVLGPGWATADRVELFANGVKVRGAEIEDRGTAGLKWSGEWTLPRPRHDLHLVAVATGPGVEGLFWPIAKPYQPTSPVVRKRVIGLTGAVWIDADGDGRRTSAYDYARKLVGDAGADWRTAVRALAGYDEAVAAQAAGLLRARGVSPADKEVRAAGEHVVRGFDAYAEAWREHVIARADAPGEPSAVLFREGFDDPRLPERGWYDGDRFTISGQQPYAGKGCVEYAWQADATNPASSSGVRRLFEPTDTVALRFYIRLSKGWGWTGRGYHPHLMHFMTTENQKFDGPAAAHLTVYVEPQNGRLRLAAQDIQNKDKPHGLTQGPLKGGFNGKFYDSKEELFTDDRWHCVEAEFRLNTLDRKADRPNADGVVRGWFDGKLVIDRTDVVLRSTDFPGMKFNQFLMLPYFGPGLLPHAQTLWIDELAVGTKRIGPIKAK